MSRPVLAIGPAAHDLRRQVGPLAWVVLEHLHELAHDDDSGAPIASTTTRELSASLGFGKDAIARALRALSSLNLITFQASRDDSGRFGTVQYQLHTPSNAITLRSIRAHTTKAPDPPTATPASPTPSIDPPILPTVATATTPEPPSPSLLMDILTPSSTAPLARRGRRRPNVDVSQLSLLGDVASVAEGRALVGVNQLGMDGSRTCISDAFNVATGVSLRIDPDPVVPCPENTDTDTNTDTGSGGSLC